MEAKIVIRIAVCDDEQYMAEKISTMVSDFFCRKNTEKSNKNHSKNSECSYSECKYFEIEHFQIEVTQFSSGESLLGSEQAFDILFLDIQMKDINGMETARRLRDRGFKGCLSREGMTAALFLLMRLYTARLSAERYICI